MNPIYLIALAMVGLSISLYIYFSKSTNTPLVCPIGHGCEDVISSKYGKTFGVENTLLGIPYYLAVIAYGTGIILNRNIFKEAIVHYFLVGISACSVLFSAYLTGVQAFVLKKWCVYCLVSSTVALLIFLTLII